MRGTFEILEAILFACENRNSATISTMTEINPDIVNKTLRGFLKKGWITRKHIKGTYLYQIEDKGKVDWAQLSELQHDL